MRSAASARRAAPASRPSLMSNSRADRRTQLRLIEALVAIKPRRDGSLSNGQDAVAQPRQFGEIARCDQRPATADDEIPDQRVDLRLDADIDSLSRFLEQQHAHAPREPFGQNDFLLVSA